ncbi:unnamed protein product, partial [Pylaiella littoralis]
VRAVASQGVTLCRHVRRRWRTPRPRNLAPLWKRSTSPAATGAQRTTVTMSWPATMRMRATGDKRGQKASVCQGTRDHIARRAKPTILHRFLTPAR